MSKNRYQSDENDGLDDGQDTSPAQPVEESVDQGQSVPDAERGGEGNQVKHAEDDEENSLRHVDDEGAVIGRRNPELPTENLTTPPAN
jgi:hypothetical protein